jgi:DNA polymerase
MEYQHELHLDLEGRSKVDLKSVGAYRYAADPSTKILMCSVSLDGAPPRLWVHPDHRTPTGLMASDPVAEEWLKYMEREDTLVWAHNLPFEEAVFIFRGMEDMGIHAPDPERCRCTMAMARRAALPQSLGQLAVVLKVSHKDENGPKLIRLFCKPQSTKKLKGQFIDPLSRPEEWEAFGRYCIQDTVVEMEIHQKLKPFEMRGDTLRTWIFDRKMNRRGVPVNTSALLNAQFIINEAQQLYAKQFSDITGLQPSQRDACLAWFRNNGYPFMDLQAPTVEEALETHTEWAAPVTKEALKLRQMTSYAAVAKVDTMLECDCGDELVRGTMVYYGAGPGRWSARLIQPQNFKRATVEDTELAYEMIQNGCTRLDLELVFGNSLETIASAIRHFIHVPGRMMYDADYSAVEARIVCWLAGQEDALERFRNNVDSYIQMASNIFDKPESLVTKLERWLGKQTVLGCGFQMGAPKFYIQCLTLAKKFKIRGLNVTEELAQKSVGVYRQLYDNVAQLWYDADRAARLAILNPGKKFKCGEKLWFYLGVVNGVPFLIMKLPSGRNIVYPFPRVIPDPERPGKTHIVYYGQLPKKENQWGDVKIYGGKFIENATQGTAADFMAYGSCNADDIGFDIFMLVHDQSLAMDDPILTIDDFVTALTKLPDWGYGMPLKAEGKVVPFYLKL